MREVIRLRPATVDDIALLERWDEDPDVIAATASHGHRDWRAELASS